jgi:predicted PurR-regulated permease PerM
MMSGVKRTVIVITLCILGWITLPLNSQTNAPRTTQQLILDKLANIEARLLVVENTQKMILREMDRRFEQVDKRFEQVDNRFSDMMNYIILMAVVFASMTGLTIGFALWDRRTMIRPFESKVKEIETTIDKSHKTVDQVQKTNDELIALLKDYAKKDRKFAEIIKGYNIF